MPDFLLSVLSFERQWMLYGINVNYFVQRESQKAKYLDSYRGCGKINYKSTLIACFQTTQGSIVLYQTCWNNILYLKPWHCFIITKTNMWGSVDLSLKNIKLSIKFAVNLKGTY